MNTERRLLKQIADEKVTQDNIAFAYTLARESGKKINWETVNKAILERWNWSALEHIKSKAWVLLNK